MTEAKEAVLDAIRNRRSVRQFTEDPVEEGDVQTILDAGRWAPSGLNNQPWRFVTVRDESVKNEIAELTRYREIIRNAPIIFSVFLESAESYDRVKDCQAIGASLQNTWLATHVLGLGGVWLGEILKNKDKVAQILETPESYELMAILAVGHPKHRRQSSQRKQLTDLVFKEV